MTQKNNELALVEMGCGDQDRLVIAGPCSAETEEQVMTIAHQVSRNPAVNIFRAGVWKPRTRPNCFEGNGVKALPWLQRVKRETGLPVAVEVARAEHVEQALAHDVDHLWIGARTTVNPFAVQEIAESLRGAETPVWVKNPINPDPGLWLGALERLNAAGVSRLGAIHRGFSTSEKGRYRNAPRWELAMNLRRQAPDLPMINDPSHITGKRDLLGEVSEKALEMGMDGLMIETHHQPEQGWSDAAQQLTPKALQGLLDALPKKEKSTVQEDGLLSALRGEIDDLDRAMLELISRRNHVAARIGDVKKHSRMSIVQPARRKELMEDRMAQATSMGLNRDIIAQIYHCLHDHAVAVQCS